VSGYRRRGTPSTSAARIEIVERHVRASWSLPLFASLATMAFVLVSIMTPHRASAETAYAPGEVGGEVPSQGYAVGGDYTSPSVARDDYSVVKLAPARPSAPASGMPDPGSAQAIAYDLVIAKGWSEGEYDCLVSLWNRESHWNIYAYNPTSGAYGIPQALPGDKMASVAADWKTNPKTQIVWGLGYIEGRYSTPCGAWAHSNAKGWY
jgi:hypothetical protein